MTPTPLELLARRAARAPEHRPWPRAVVDDAGWHLAARALERGELVLLGLWGDEGAVHMALLDERAREVAVVTRACPEGRFPSVGALHPPAIRLERAVRDLWGLEPEGTPDPRPWLDHGRWPTRAPLGEPCRQVGEARPSVPGNGYTFLPAEGDDLHQIPVGPVHAGIIEPGHFRFTQSGEAVVRLEERLGYVHKGVESLLRGASLERAAPLAGHVSGDSTVAYQIAFARAVEAALGWQVPARAVWLRALMAELERLANHVGDVGAIFNDAAFTILHANCQILREEVLRASATCFGHRLMMDRIVPGGLACDLPPEGATAVRALLPRVRESFAEV
ncbi:MAG TPA: NADH-quinone oxidoreductase subunit C, partial [Longimicrobiales bacterium]|nr:NADH-quinone oxidoreductase subunit C [Longimicrobiales bacterium]